MEHSLEKVVNDVVAHQSDVVGCLIANRQGLCICARGKVNTKASGIVTAISEQACKLEPKLNPPTICLYSGNKRCIIQKDGDVTAVIYKEGASN